MDNSENVSSTNITKLETRIQNKYDSFDNWNAESAVTLLPGGIAGLATVATSGSYNDLSSAPEIDKTLSETSTDENVPSSKCVYDAIQSAIGDALGGSY